MQALHESDFYLWCLEQSERLRSENAEMLDFKNLAEEILSMGRSERSQLVNRLEVLICHMLKWDYQPEKRKNDWKCTIKEQKRGIEKLLKNNPSLKPQYNECVYEAYPSAREMASDETGLGIKTFPEEESWFSCWNFYKLEEQY